METPESAPITVPSYAERRAQIASTSRLSLPAPIRIFLATSTSVLVGASLGLSHGSKTAGLVFRAENAHRLPATPAGWYLYHKSKNYHMALGGVKEGMKMGVKLGVWTFIFFGIEDAWDEIRGRRDVLSTVIASLSVAGGFCLWNRFPLTTAAKTAKQALVVGVGFGLAQDAMAVMRGNRPGYVNFMLRGRNRKSSEQEAVTS